MTAPSEARRQNLVLHGRLDASATARLEAQLKALYDVGVVDIDVVMGDVSYMSSSVLRILLLAHRRQQERAGSVSLLQVPPRVMRILTLCGFDQVLDLEPQIHAHHSASDNAQS